MNIELTKKEFRHLLDLVYIGNWILNSVRGADRFEEYDLLQEKFFALAAQAGMSELMQLYLGHVFPSRAYEDGGIHDAIADYEDAVFFDILAEELSRRDMIEAGIDPDDTRELTKRMDGYMSEFERSGIESLRIDD